MAVIVTICFIHFEYVQQICMDCQKKWNYWFLPLFAHIKKIFNRLTNCGRFSVQWQISTELVYFILHLSFIEQNVWIPNIHESAIGEIMFA
jgi:hypothetical protein